MSLLTPDLLQETIQTTVGASLAEDVGAGDLTAQLIPAGQWVSGHVISRENATIAGCAWVNEVFRQVDPTVELEWLIQDGEQVNAATTPTLFRFIGPARSVMTAERTALNWLQTLSGVATRCRYYADKVAHTGVRLLDTRKTLPGMRLAQKYAVTQGGCHNHRIGLFDAFLIKENHIAACGSIAKAVQEARRLAPGKPVEVETENLQELEEAVQAGADIVMLDEFPHGDLLKAVATYKGQVQLEASGGINDSNLVAIAETGVDCISLGTLTKDVTAVDLSLRVTNVATNQ